MNTPDRTSSLIAPAEAGALKQTYLRPELSRYGSVAQLTAGGTRPNGTEFWIVSCNSQSVFIRC